MRLALSKEALNDVGEAESGADFLHGACNPAGQLFGFEYAGAGDQQQGESRTDFKGRAIRAAHRYGGDLHQFFLLLVRAALMKSRNSGCGFIGLDLNSGWNWQPRNQG